MLKKDAKWLNARENAMKAIPECVWEWADKENAWIKYDDLKRLYIVDSPEEWTTHTLESLVSFCENELKEIKRAEWYNGLSDLDRAFFGAAVAAGRIKF